MYVRIIPQGTVDNNLGPDRLASPKTLDPKYWRQPNLRSLAFYRSILKGT